MQHSFGRNYMCALSFVIQIYIIFYSAMFSVEASVSLK